VSEPAGAWVITVALPCRYEVLCARRAEEAVQVHPCSVNYGLARFDSRYLVRRRLGLCLASADVPANCSARGDLGAC